ncbi:hypothetical protein FB45DRAFT_868444 [Roridomyces roridus]|uniref:Peptidase C14 caspase domain-containing protein n=1 Tax=Roridomyces roridus TaxID=1738132 RepID=A0AAD7BQ00_9AGAR|nr:hypothetical protein FB45DRAFT_868444 [Roridomyces roridus]
MADPQPKKVFALIIGINEYIAQPYLPTLRGCVNDAKLFKEFLGSYCDQRGLELHAKVLLDKEATRKAILGAFDAHLINNVNHCVLRNLDTRLDRYASILGNVRHFSSCRCAANIAMLGMRAPLNANLSLRRKYYELDTKEGARVVNIPDNGDTPMIFFFAGHGSRVEATTTSPVSADGKIETICPHDEHDTDVDGQYVHGIPDYVLLALLCTLADRKGDNITVILDSCHSSGMARGLVDEAAGTAHSAIFPSLPIPPSLDRHLLLHTQHSAPQICVILAACQQDEFARECTLPGDSIVHGRFTRALIDQLRLLLPTRPTTYKDLHTSLNQTTLDKQSPSCIGDNGGRLVFTCALPPRGAGVLPLRRVSSGAPAVHDDTPAYSLVVDMGSVEGVVEGTEFAVYDEHNGTAVPGMLFQAGSVKIHECLLLQVGDWVIPENARVMLYRWNNTKGALKVHLAEGFPYVDVVFPTIQTGLTATHRYVKSAPEEAHVVLRTSDAGRVLVVERCLAAMRVDGVVDMQIPLQDNHSNIPTILDEIAHFNDFLLRTNESADRPFGERCELRMYRLTGERGERIRDPAYDNLVKMDAENVLVAEIGSEKGVLYGFEIVNHSADDIWAYLYIFDTDEYKITSVYTHTHGTPPVHKYGGIASVGFGANRGWEFTLPAGQSVSSAFLKLFVATHPLHLEWIRRKDRLHAGVGRLEAREEEHPESWDTAMVRLTMRAAPVA